MVRSVTDQSPKLRVFARVFGAITFGRLAGADDAIRVKAKLIHLAPVV
jgi:hypothetical protein